MRHKLDKFLISLVLLFAVCLYAPTMLKDGRPADANRVEAEADTEVQCVSESITYEQVQSEVLMAPSTEELVMKGVDELFTEMVAEKNTEDKDRIEEEALQAAEELTTEELTTEEVTTEEITEETTTEEAVTEEVTTEEVTTEESVMEEILAAEEIANLVDVLSTEETTTVVEMAVEAVTVDEVEQLAQEDIFKDTPVELSWVLGFDLQAEDSVLIDKRGESVRELVGEAPIQPTLIPEEEKAKAEAIRANEENFKELVASYYAEKAAKKRQSVQVAYASPAGDGVLTPSKGVNYGPSGKETYYNLNMSGVISTMESLGYNETYWVREDGVKMYGDYVMVAANLNTHPRGSIVDSSLGKAIVVDTGGFAASDPNQLDIATAW